jgi:RNase P subunit RPR2
MGQAILIKKPIGLTVDTKAPETFDQVTCKCCGALLFKAKNFLAKSESRAARPFQIEIRCRRCKKINLF